MSKATAKVAPRTSDERIEDLAFEGRIKALVKAHKWDELRAVFLMFGSALTDREEASHE